MRRQKRQRGQALFEVLLLTMLFLILIAGMAKEIPLTFSQTSPYLGSDVESRLETGHGYGAKDWKAPMGKTETGGMRDL